MRRAGYPAGGVELSGRGLFSLSGDSNSLSMRKGHVPPWGASQLPESHGSCCPPNLGRALGGPAEAPFPRGTENDRYHNKNLVRRRLADIPSSTDRSGAICGGDQVYARLLQGMARAPQSVGV